MAGLKDTPLLPSCARYLTEPPEPTVPAWAPTAPLPADPLECRWCGGRLRALLEDGPATYCERGCERNDQGTYTADCHECERPFKTGTVTAVRCSECIEAERQAEAAHRAGDVDVPRYESEEFGRGRWRY